MNEKMLVLNNTDIKMGKMAQI